MAKLDSSEDPLNINIPKVITNENLDLIYMSRLAIPGFKTLKINPQVIINKYVFMHSTVINC